MYDTYMPVDQVDETAHVTEMMGPSSTLNQMTGSSTWRNNPTKALIVLWGLVIVLYWGCGVLFRNHTS